MRVVIVDDQQIFRDAVRGLLMARGYEVVAEASCAATAVEAVERHEPDAVLLDIRLGDDDGFSVCEAVTRIRPSVAVILTSTEKNYENFPQHVESCGARAFVRKEHLPQVDLARFLPTA